MLKGGMRVLLIDANGDAALFAPVVVYCFF